MFAQIKKQKNDKKSLQGKLDQLTNKEPTIDEKTMANPIEIKKSLNVKIETMEEGINSYLIEILSTIKSLEVLKVEHSQNKTQDTRMSYDHPNYKGHQWINQSQNQYEKISEDPIILKRSSNVESYHFPNC